MKRFRDFLKEADVFTGAPKGGLLTPRSRPPGLGPSSPSPELRSRTMPAYGGQSVSGPHGALPMTSPGKEKPRMNLQPQDTETIAHPFEPNKPLQPGGSFYKDLSPGSQLQDKLSSWGSNPRISSEGGKKGKKKK